MGKNPVSNQPWVWEQGTAGENSFTSKSHSRNLFMSLSLQGVGLVRWSIPSVRLEISQMIHIIIHM